MKNPRWIVLLTCLFLQQNYLPAQDKLNIKFGKVSPEDFDLSKVKYDSGAAAVIIADIGNTSFEGNHKGDFTLIFKRFKRVKIINKNGFDAADESFTVYHDGLDEERLSDVKAITYNLENGQIIQTKLDEKSIFTDKLDKFKSRKKFTMPAVKEGSIIEIEYTIKSDFYYGLRAWNFQGEYPRLWSEYEVRIPSFFHYVQLSQGDQAFFVKTGKSEPTVYAIRESGGTESDENYQINAFENVIRWVKKDVPPLKEESYTTTISNHISRIEFQLHYVQFNETSERHTYMGDWFMASEKMLKNPNFGGALDDDNHWMAEELRTITAGCHSDLEKIQKIYAFVRDNFTCTDYDEIYTDNPLKLVFKKRNGNVAEINLLLTAMLRHENIKADPMVLSTRDNGYPSEIYPLMSRFNYVICSASDQEKTYYLDASRPRLGFGYLPIDCYNGMARTINKEKPYAVYFSPDSLKETKQTSVIIINDEKGFPSGSFQSVLGNIESFELREKIKKKSEKTFFKDIQTAYGSDIELENEGLDSLTQLEKPVNMHYEFNLKSLASEDILYFNPMLSEGYKDNPFKAAERTYPVEMPYCFDEVYNLNMEIPNGYTVEELPKSARVALNETQGFFEYLIQKGETGIQMRSHIRLNKANFTPDEYNVLRDFFAYVVKKQSEQIVFKKKK
jgi:Domain of Unknown Function with PDB structure (DUF3858)/Transglutaminase-like superfamily